MLQSCEVDVANSPDPMTWVPASPSTRGAVVNQPRIEVAILVVGTFTELESKYCSSADASSPSACRQGPAPVVELLSNKVVYFHSCGLPIRNRTCSFQDLECQPFIMSSGCKVRIHHQQGICRRPSALQETCTVPSAFTVTVPASVV